MSEGSNWVSILNSRWSLLGSLKKVIFIYSTRGGLCLDNGAEARKNTLMPTSH